MAYNPAASHPTKTIAPSADYPYGSAQDETLPYDGTGYPWQAPVIDDYMGFFQGLLVRAGITPSGAPDTVLVSDYLSALSAIAGDRLPFTTAILSASLPGVVVVATDGWASQADAGGGRWYATGVTSPGDAGTGPSPAGMIYDLDGREFAMLSESISPRQYGATGDGVTDDTAALIACLAYAASDIVGTVRMGEGRYVAMEALTLPTMVQIDGRSAIVDFSGAPLPAVALGCVVCHGVATAIAPAISSVAKGAIAVTFAGAHGLAEGDQIYLIDSANGSFSPAQDWYRAGETNVVASVPSATTITMREPTSFAYPGATAAAASVSQVRCEVSGLEIISRPGALAALSISHAAAPHVVDVRTQSGGIRIANAVRAVVRSCDAYADPGGSDRGIQILNCTAPLIEYCHGHSSLNGLEVGGADVPWAIPTTAAVVMSGAYGRPSVGSSIPGLRVMGNCIGTEVLSAHAQGVSVGGYATSVTRCHLSGGGTGPAIQVAETVGNDHAIIDCTMKALSAMVGVGVIDMADTDQASPGSGSIRVSGGSIEMNGFAGLAARFMATTGGAGADLSIADLSTDGDILIDQNAAGEVWGIVSIQSSHFDLAGLFVRAAESLVISDDCTFRDSPGHAIEVLTPGSGVPFAEFSVVISDTEIKNPNQAGVWINMPHGGSSTRLFVSGCNVKNCNDGGSGLAMMSSLAIQDVDRVVISGSVVGDTRAVPKQINSYAIQACGRVTIQGMTVEQGGSDLEPYLIAIANLKQIGSSSDSSANAVTSCNQGVAGADPDDAPVGSRGLVSGDGITCISDPNGTGIMSFSDGGSSGSMEFNHLTGQGHLKTSGVDIVWEPGALRPAGAGGLSLGTDAIPWGACQIQDVHVGAITADKGTAVVPGDIFLDPRWGVGRSVTVRGTRTAGVITITAGTSAILANPATILIYPDGPWPLGAPAVSVSRLQLGKVFEVFASDDTALNVAYDGTPSAGQTYGFSYIAIGV